MQAAREMCRSYTYIYFSVTHTSEWQTTYHIPRDFIHCICRPRARCVAHIYYTDTLPYTMFRVSIHSPMSAAQARHMCHSRDIRNVNERVYYTNILPFTMFRVSIHPPILCLGFEYTALFQQSSLLWSDPVGARQLRAKVLRRRAPRPLLRKMTLFAIEWLCGVATISRLLKIIGLFCKRAL